MTPDTEVGGPGTSDESDQPREESKARPGPGEFITKLGDVSKWAVGALAAAGAFAVANFGLSKLGRGPTTKELNAWHWPGGVGWAFLSAAMVAVGAVALVGAIIWQSRSSRVSMNYLQSLSGYYIRHDIEQRMPYLLSGNTTLEGFINEYTSLAGKEDTARVRQLEASRFAILETASAERAQGLVKYLLPTMIIGAVAIAGGAALLSYTVNVGELLREDQLVVMKQQREDALKELATGELLPRTPAISSWCSLPVSPRRTLGVRPLATAAFWVGAPSLGRYQRHSSRSVLPQRTIWALCQVALLVSSEL